MKNGYPKAFFLFFQNGIRDATSGGMGKGDKDPVGDKKIVEDNQMYNPEGNQQEQFYSKDGLEIRYEKYIRVSKRTSKRDVFQDQNFLIKKLSELFQKKNMLTLHHFFEENLIKQIQQ